MPVKPSTKPIDAFSLPLNSSGDSLDKMSILAPAESENLSAVALFWTLRLEINPDGKISKGTTLLLGSGEGRLAPLKVTVV